MKGKKAFIKCSDKDTIRQLEELGYKKISDANGVATFINDLSKPQTYANNKVVYTSLMMMS